MDKKSISEFSSQVKKELDEGLQLLNRIDKSIISFLGGSKFHKDSEMYKDTKELAAKLGKKNYAILTGGGPGIMCAANEGAIESGTYSLSFSTRSLEQISEPIFTHQLSCKHLFVVRFLLAVRSDALVFYPGGYGTLNELFEYLALMQTGIVEKVPIICVDKDYWKGLFEWLKSKPFELKQISSEDIDLAAIVSDSESVLKIINEKVANSNKMKV